MRAVGWVVVLAMGCAPLGLRDRASPDRFSVMLEVDFGPAGKPAVRETVEVPAGATPEDVLRARCAIQKGAVCCDPREVSGIEGVPVDPGQNRWWSVSVNGDRKGVSPWRTPLKPGDRVVWEYREYAQ